MFFLTYLGQLTKIGPPSKAVTMTPMQTQPNVFQILLSKSGVSSKYTRDKTMHDIEALLFLPPAHSAPSLTAENHPGEAAGPAQVGERGKVVENNNENKDEDKMKKLMKIEDVFKF